MSGARSLDPPCNKEHNRNAVGEMQPEPRRDEDAPTHTFRQSRSGDFLATLLLVAPFASWLIHQSVASAVPTIIAMIIGLPWWWRRLDRRALTLTDAGFEVTTLFGSKRLRWSECFYVYLPQSNASTSQGLVADAAINIAASVAGVLAHRRRLIGTKLTVTDTNGSSVCLDDYADARGVEPEVVAHIHRCADGETSPFDVASSEVRHGGKTLTFSQLERVVVATPVQFFRAGDRSAWASASLASVHNVWLLVERLLEHGVSVELAVEAPSSVVASVEALAARQAKMPRATIVSQ